MNQDIYEAIADPTRRTIVELLAGRAVPVHQIASHFEISRPAVSKHLRVLKRAGLVNETQIGRERHYQLDRAPLREVGQWIDSFWADRLADLKALVETRGGDS